MPPTLECSSPRADVPCPTSPPSAPRISLFVVVPSSPAILFSRTGPERGTVSSERRSSSPSWSLPFPNDVFSGRLGDAPLSHLMLVRGIVWCANRSRAPDAAGRTSARYSENSDRSTDQPIRPGQPTDRPTDGPTNRTSLPASDETLRSLLSRGHFRSRCREAETAPRRAVSSALAPRHAPNLYRTAPSVCPLACLPACLPACRCRQPAPTHECFTSLPLPLISRLNPTAPRNAEYCMT